MGAGSETPHPAHPLTLNHSSHHSLRQMVLLRRAHSPYDHHGSERRHRRRLDRGANPLQQMAALPPSLRIPTPLGMECPPVPLQGLTWAIDHQNTPHPFHLLTHPPTPREDNPCSVTA